MRKITFSNMNCKHCLKRITEILKEHNIKVKKDNLAEKYVMVLEITNEALEAIKENGFNVTSIE